MNNTKEEENKGEGGRVKKKGRVGGWVRLKVGDWGVRAEGVVDIYVGHELVMVVREHRKKEE